MRMDEKIYFRISREKKEYIEDLLDMYDMELSDFMRMLIDEKLEDEGYIRG